MSDFKVKMHKIRLSLGLRPRPVEELTELPGPLAVFEGSRPTSKRRERGKGKNEKKMKSKGAGRGDEVEGRIWLTQKFWPAQPMTDP